MTEALQIVFEPLPSVELERFLEDNVVAYNYAQTGVSEWHPVGFFLRNGRGEWLGGCTGYAGAVGCMFAGCGSRRRCAGAGTGRGCWRRRSGSARSAARRRRPWRRTVSGPRAFYLKLGYTVFGTLEDYPPGHSKYFLRKPLR